MAKAKAYARVQAQPPATNEIFLDNIDILSKQVRLRPEAEWNSEKVSYQILTEQKVNFSDKLIFIGVRADILYEDIKDPLAEFYIACIFDIPDFDHVVKKKANQQIIIADTLLDRLSDIAISTTRGIVYSELRGTYLDKTILPIVNQNEFELVSTSL
jgi:hypothetical protein